MSGWIKATDESLIKYVDRISMYGAWCIWDNSSRWIEDKDPIPYNWRLRDGFETPLYFYVSPQPPEYTHSHKEKLDDLKANLDCAESELQESYKKMLRCEVEVVWWLEQKNKLETGVVEFKEMIETLTESIRELEEKE